MFSKELELFLRIFFLKPSRLPTPNPLPPLCGFYKGLTTGSRGIWWPLSFLWLDKVAQLLVSFPTDAANGGGWGGVSLCGQRGNSIFTRIRPGPCQSWVCYIKLHSVFSVLLLELLFTETTQPTTLPWAHGELSYNCPHTAGCLELASSEPTGDVSSRTISHSSEISSHKES